MKHISLFSGIGGFDLAADWMGWGNVAHVEFNPFCQRILKYYWPDAESYGDIKEFNGTKYRGTIDIVSGGFPCQPFSSAGKRKGESDERYLWPEMLRVIREIQPAWIVGENVAGILSMDDGKIFDQILSDLESEGYAVQAFIIPACAVQAPHRRDRVWIVAHAPSVSWRSTNKSEQGEKEVQEKRPNERGTTSNPHKNGRGKHSGISEVNTKGIRKGLAKGHEPNKQDESGIITKPDRRTSRQGNTKREPGQCFEKPGFEQFPTVSPIHARDDGLSNRLDGITLAKWRKESIKAAGNAVVPQVVYEIFKAIDTIHKQQMQ